MTETAKFLPKGAGHVAVAAGAVPVPVARAGILRGRADRFGAVLAQEVMNMCLLTRRRDEGFDLDACAAHLNLSRRQIERLFAAHPGVTPVRYMNNLRLARGRNMA